MNSNTQKGVRSRGNQKFLMGFTLIELLVVVAIIGLLTSIISFALSTSRAKARDARRLSDMQQIKSGLDIYYSNGSGYPPEADWTTAQSSGGQLSCSGTAALRVPDDPLHSSTPSFTYAYTAGGTSFDGCGGTVYSNYKVQFQTEGDSSIGPAGIYYLSPQGIGATPPF